VCLLPEDLEALIGGNADRVTLLTGFVFPPDNPNRGVDLSWHLSALRDDPKQVLWRIRVIVERSSKTVVGSINLKGPPDPEGDVEIGWGLNESAQKRGYATEAAAAMIHWLFQQPGVASASATISDDNYRSQRLAATLGFVRTGHTRNYRPLWKCDRKPIGDPCG
jgi:RimJ/RimL family protein N-acetyltransferase